MHGNSKKNPNPHHLYGIFEEETGKVFKYGITDDPLCKDGLPSRARKQVKLFNLAAGFLKFVARVLLSGIAGREKAEKIERKYIEDHEKKYGFKPPGNLR